MSTNLSLAESKLQGGYNAAMKGSHTLYLSTGYVDVVHFSIRAKGSGGTYNNRGIR